ncbi:hypothetical protein NQ315_015323 [Exocentrus adspersus]|uniref:Mutator-like transposase domain-containing protein n=1 Tax=Exocentrus adspersus TaxID=1586481 RepID=A0AAV8V6U4_9CUCU|nr:hypothetical protein NQ315_015323 [Exocentrus adspersus]
MEKRRGGHVCAVKNCKFKRYDSNKSFFRFPRDPIREAEKANYAYSVSTDHDYIMTRTRTVNECDNICKSIATVDDKNKNCGKEKDSNYINTDTMQLIQDDDIINGIDKNMLNVNFGTEVVMEHELCIEKESPVDDTVLSGHRVVDLKYVLNWALDLQVRHSKICTTGMLHVISEERFGLVSKVVFKCNLCEYETSKYTENPTKKKSRINYGVVWGTLSTGSTYTRLKEQLSVLDVPSISYRLFHAIEIHLGDHWKSTLWASIEEAGKEEHRIAVEKQQIDQNKNVWTKVYLDGGWSHRSYGHNYNAASGTAVIIGALTGKVLYLGVRNKYCSICSRANNKEEQPKSHICFKNWSQSSGAMEADIIVEGFTEGPIMHNLKYLKFVADGDSSVFAKIKENVPYGDEVEKVECKNHAIKNYGSGLYKIKSDTKIHAAGRRLLTVQKN